MRLVIKLIRHGESAANRKEVSHLDVGDHSIPLSETGWEQARQAGERLSAEFLRDALIYVSPYLRTRQTLQGILEGSGLSEEGPLKIYEDPRLREVDHGYEDVEDQLPLRALHGWFYYRFRGGESPADCFDRTSSFLESMMRQVQRKAAERVLIVTHGLTIRCFVMRFLHLSVEHFDSLAGPDNCDIITLAAREELMDSLYESGRWGVSGLKLRND
jgi:broad specificity phosphatase PhoE